jgi:Fe2+ or Zn2+ uptake regulation protein
VDEALRGLASEAGYTIQAVAIEARGRCMACREDLKEHPPSYAQAQG